MEEPRCLIIRGRAYIATSSASRSEQTKIALFAKKVKVLGVDLDKFFPVERTTQNSLVGRRKRDYVAGKTQKRPKGVLEFSEELPRVLKGHQAKHIVRIPGILGFVIWDPSQAGAFSYFAVWVRDKSKTVLCGCRRDGPSDNCPHARELRKIIDKHSQPANALEPLDKDSSMFWQLQVTQNQVLIQRVEGKMVDSPSVAVIAVKRRDKETNISLQAEVFTDVRVCRILQKTKFSLSCVHGECDCSKYFAGFSRERVFATTLSSGQDGVPQELDATEPVHMQDGKDILSSTRLLPFYPRNSAEQEAHLLTLDIISGPSECRKNACTSNSFYDRREVTLSVFTTMGMRRLKMQTCVCNDCQTLQCADGCEHGIVVVKSSGMSHAVLDQILAQYSGLGTTLHRVLEGIKLTIDRSCGAKGQKHSEIMSERTMRSITERYFSLCCLEPLHSRSSKLSSLFSCESCHNIWSIDGLVLGHSWNARRSVEDQKKYVWWCAKIPPDKGGSLREIYNGRRRNFPSV